jgi:hypothetical protein
VLIDTVNMKIIPNRAAQTGVFDLDIRISNGLFIDVCASCVAETGVKSRNVEKKINDCLSGPNLIGEQIVASRISSKSAPARAAA